MFTILKVREDLARYDGDPGWYDNPPGTLASLAPADVLRRNGIAADGSSAPKPPTGVWKQPAQAATRPADATHGHGGASGATTQTSGNVYTCPMHAKVVSNEPGRCPKCKMKLVAKK